MADFSEGFQPCQYHALIGLCKPPALPVVMTNGNPYFNLLCYLLRLSAENSDGRSICSVYERDACIASVELERCAVSICENEGCCLAGLAPSYLDSLVLVSIPPKISVSSFMGYLKGKSSLMIFDKHANMKYRYGNREFWCRGYYVDTLGKNKKAIAEYIRNQLQKDLAYEQMSIKELVDPFTGEPVHASKK